jgi:hypothetical protein
MAPGVNLLELLDRCFGVNGPGIQLLVAEELLGEADVCGINLDADLAPKEKILAKTTQ